MVDVATATLEQCEEAAALRGAAAEKHRPTKIRYLLVAEMPPDDLDRYFYFDTVDRHDHLFRNVLPHFLTEKPLKSGKAAQLEKLCALGVYLIDLKPDPCAAGAPETYADDLVARVLALEPDNVILIKVNVWDAAAQQLKAAGVNLIDERLCFPSSGQQTNFRNGFRKALEKAGWTSLAPE